MVVIHLFGTTSNVLCRLLNFIRFAESWDNIVSYVMCSSDQILNTAVTQVHVD